MREALARTTNDFKVSRRAPRPSKKQVRSPAFVRLLARSLLRQFWIRPATTIAGAAFAALMTGIALNALVMQKARHPAPLFGTVPRQVAAPAAEPRPVAAPVVPAAVPLPAARPAEPARKPDSASVPSSVDPIAQLLKPGAANQPAATARKTGATTAGDLIGHFLKSTAAKEPVDPVGQLIKREAAAAPGNDAEASDKNVLAAQRALAKLGYSVKPDGVLGQTTRQAIERFQKDHHMIVNDRLTPRVMRELTIAAGASAE